MALGTQFGGCMKIGDLVMVTSSYKEENIGKLAIVLKLGDSRMNIAGLNSTTVPLLARAIVDAGI